MAVAINVYPVDGLPSKSYKKLYNLGLLVARLTVRPTALLIMIVDEPVENIGIVKYSLAAIAASRLTATLI